MSTSEPILVPLASRNAAAGLATSASAHTVGMSCVTSNTPSPRIATTDGPDADGSQTRPTSVPVVPSSGKIEAALSAFMAFPLFCWLAKRSDQPRQCRLRIALYPFQMRRVTETFRIDLADVLGTRRPRREPAHLGFDLDAAEGLAVAGRRGAGRAHAIAGQLLHA